MAKTKTTRDKSTAATQAVEWHQFDASEVVLGRLATQATHLLLGKHRPDFAAHKVAPVFVVVTNAAKLRVTGDKMAQKLYHRFSGYPGGISTRTLEQQLERDPGKVISQAVSGMLPKNNLRGERLKHLKVYAGPEHPHTETVNKS